MPYGHNQKTRLKLLQRSDDEEIDPVESEEEGIIYGLNEIITS